MRSWLAIVALVAVSGCAHLGGGDHPSPDASPIPADSGVPADAAPATGFVHVEDGRLVDGAGAPLLLRSMSVGNWLFPEGYMWQLDGPRGDRPRRIEQRIVELIGADRAAAFWTAYRDNFLAEADIARMHELGFNAIRLAMNARHLAPDGDGTTLDDEALGYLTRTVDWCRRHGVYVILDMHGAPGGQTGANIDDNENDRPDLYTVPAHQDRLVAIWTALARRFADDPTVLGYDLLNEPIAPDFASLNDRLWPIYLRVGAAIRAVDPHHTLIVEGAQWANNWSALHEPFDDNLIYSFHKYWDDPGDASIRGYLDGRTRWNRPLWTGEIGENDDDWYRAVFPMLERNDVGWSFWTWKKLGSDNNPYAIVPPARWSLFQDYVADPARRPSAADAQAVLDELAANAALARNRYVEHAACAIVACP